MKNSTLSYTKQYLLYIQYLYIIYYQFDAKNMGFFDIEPKDA